MADASSRPLSPPRERHGPCRAATTEPPTGRVVPPTAPRARALSRRRRWSSANAVGAAPSPSDGVPSPLADASSRPLSPPRERHGPCRAATIEPPTGRVVPPTAPRVRALSRRRRWSSANAVGAAPSPSDAPNCHRHPLCSPVFSEGVATFSALAVSRTDEAYAMPPASARAPNMSAIGSALSNWPRLPSRLYHHRRGECAPSIAVFAESLSLVASTVVI